jgi:hypothetical protein
MKDKRKNGKQTNKSAAPQQSSEGPRNKRLKPVDKTKYKLNRYQLPEDSEEEEDFSLFDYLEEEED